MRNTLLLIFTIVFCQFVIAQEDVNITEKINDNNEQLQFAKFSKNINGASDEAIKEIIQFALNYTDNNITFKLKQEQVKDDLSYEHKEYQQYYKDVKIYGATYAVHIKDRSVEFINGEFANLSNFNIKPILSEAIILKNALIEAQNKNNSITENQISVAGLIIAKDVFSDRHEYKLCYEVYIKNTNDQINEIYFIDAETGKILNKEFKVCHINTTNAIAQTAYSGIQNYTNGFPISSPNFVTDSHNGGFRLRETRQGVVISTFNNLGFSYAYVSSATSITDNDNNWTQVEHGNNRFALDAHWGAEKVFDYWKTVHNRNSINNNGMEIKNYINSTFYAGTPNNASWHNGYMSYGNGDGTTYRNFTSLDICAHEFGHGICEYTCNLAYNYNESGSLNEGFSDIWGAVIEAWAMPNNPPKARWLIGEEIYIPTPSYLRSMSNPNSSPSPQPDTYGGTFWTNGGIEMHKGSGVLNFWFFLLSEGGCNTNDLNNNYFVPAIGITDAAKIAYKTEQLLSSGSNYSQARTMSIQAAQILFGSGSIQERAVKRAWFAVGVGTNDPSNNNLFAINGTSSICTSQTQTLIATNLPNGSSVSSWSASPANAVTLVQNGNSCNVTRNGNSNDLVIITANIITCNGNITANKSINVGNPYVLFPVNPPQYPGALIYDTINENNCNYTCYHPSIYRNYSISDPYNGTVTWQKISSWPANVAWIGNNSTVSVLLKAVNQNITLKRTLTNPCNSASPIVEYYCFWATGSQCSSLRSTPPVTVAQQLKVYPNPASINNALTLELTSDKGDAIDFENSSIQLVDAQNVIIVQKSGNKITKEKLEIPALSNGVYYIKVTNKNGVSTQQLIIKN